MLRSVASKSGASSHRNTFSVLAFERAWNSAFAQMGKYPWRAPQVCYAFFLVGLLRGRRKRPRLPSWHSKSAAGFCSWLASPCLVARCHSSVDGRSPMGRRVRTRAEGSGRRSGWRPSRLGCSQGAPSRSRAIRERRGGLPCRPTEQRAASVGRTRTNHADRERAVKCPPSQPAVVLTVPIPQYRTAFPQKKARSRSPPHHPPR
jgi:hypothetical protein